MSSALESEDLENIPLVRMEDVQPSRTYELITSGHTHDIVILDNCVIADIEYDNAYVVNDDDDSNVGSMVSIQSEEVVEDDSEPEMIVPEMLEDDSSVLEPITTYHGLNVREEPAKPPSSWPTLEILPGGVIMKPQHIEPSPAIQRPRVGQDQLISKPEEMMYACAKCPQRFKFLFSLVKHVKWHEDENKKLLGQNRMAIKHKSCAKLCRSKSKKQRVLLAENATKKKSPKKIKS